MPWSSNLSTGSGWSCERPVAESRRPRRTAIGPGAAIAGRDLESKKRSLKPQSVPRLRAKEDGAFRRREDQKTGALLVVFPVPLAAPIVAPLLLPFGPNIVLAFARGLVSALDPSVGVACFVVPVIARGGDIAFASGHLFVDRRRRRNIDVEIDRCRMNGKWGGQRADQ